MVPSCSNVGYPSRVSRRAIICDRCELNPSLPSSRISPVSPPGQTRKRDLRGNDFTTLPAGLFDSLEALTTLNLSYNELETLPAGLFGSLEALTTL